MPTYSLEELEQYWHSNVQAFGREYADCTAVFHELMAAASPLVAAVTGRQSLEPNCAFVVLTKMLNHALASFSLVTRGLFIDAGLAARNTLETALLFELLCKDSTLCGEWSAGKAFRPSDVRKRLAHLPSVALGELVVNVSADEYEDARFAYDWLSRISHANVDSIGHAARKGVAGQVELTIGGALPKRAEVVALTKIIGHSCLRALLAASAAHAPDLVYRKLFHELTERVHAVKVKTGA